MRGLFTILFCFVILFKLISQTVILNQPFTDGTLPSGWSQTDVTFTTAAGGYANFTSTSAVLTSPIVDLSTYSNVSIDFDVAKFGTGGDGPITVEISSDGGTTWTSQTYNSPTPTSSTYLHSGPTYVSTLSSSFRIRFIRTNSPSQKRFRNLVLTANIPLPVKFSDISIKSTKETNILSFSTLSEVNNDFFEIERSSDAHSFSSIGKVDGAGNSSKLVEYTFTDDQPLNGVSYYRVKQVDHDGQYAYSNVVSTTNDKSSKFTVSNRNNALSINTQAEDYNVYIYNTGGQLIRSYMNLSTEQNIDLEGLESGLLIVKTQHGQLTESHKINKL